MPQGAIWRANAWPDRDRVRIFALMLLLAYVPMMARVFVEATGHVGSDFLAFWGAGRLVLAGTPQAAYDLIAEHGAQAASHTGQMVAYVNPPPYLFLTLPLGALPYPAAWLAWALAGWGAWFALCRRLLPGDPLVILAFPAAEVAASHAQNGFVTAILLIGAVMAVDRGRSWLGGLLLGALVIKPHLALLAPLWLLAGRDGRAIVGGLLGAALSCLAAWAAFGTATWLAWPQSFAVSKVLMAQAGGPFFLRMATPYAALRVLAGPQVAMAGQGAIMLAVAVLLWRQTRRHGVNAGTGALMLAGTALASPYLFAYDFPFLIQPVAWLIVMARRHGWRPGEKLGLIALWFAPLATRAAALPLGINLMPLAALALVWLVATRLDQASSKG